MPDVVQIIIQTIDQSSGANHDVTTSLSGLLEEVGATVVGFEALVEVSKLVAEELRADISAAADDQAALSRLNMTIQSTGRSGEISAAQLDKLASSPLFDDAQINEAANALARFMDIPSQDIPKDLVIIENMAVALGVDLPSAAQTFGQAMETGRVRGLGFSRELTTEISQLMSAGEVQKADAIILEQLSLKYSGQASASLETYNGKVQALKTSEEQLRAEMGQGPMALASGVTDQANSAIVAVKNFSDANEQMKSANDFAVSIMGNWVTQMRGTNDWTQQQEQQYQGLINEYKMLGDGTGYANTELDKYNGTLRSNNQLVLDSREGNIQFFESLRAQDDELVFIQQAIAKTGTSWEQMYDGAKTAQDKTDMSTKLIGDAVSSMATQVSGEGAMVWNGYLAATGKISPAAIMEFIKLEDFIHTEIPKIQSYLDRGLSVTLAVKMLTQDMAAAGVGDSASSGAESGYVLKGTRNGPGSGSAWFNASTGQWHFGTTDTGWAKGGDFMVPPGFPNDSYSMRVQSGEHVSVTPAGQKSPSGAGHTFNFYYPNQTSDPAGDMRRVAISLSALGVLQ